MMVLVILLLFGGLLLAVLCWAGSGKTIHETQGSGIIEAIPAVLEQEPAAAGTLVVLSYALGYGLDGQRYRTATSAAAIYNRLDRLIETLVETEADVALLQEVDFASQRTHDIDQLHYIAAALGWGYAARAMTWECRYVPYPVWPYGRPLGCLRAGMGVISRYPLVQNTRQRLPQRHSVPLLARWFAPYHTVQMVDVQCGPQTIRLFNGHLEPHDIPTRQRQAQQLVEFLQYAATPTSVLMGALHAAAGESCILAQSADPVLRFILDELRGRFRAVPDRGSATPGTVPLSVPYVFMGSDVRVSAQHTIPLDEPGTTYPLAVVHLRWTVPLVVSQGRNHHERR
jgi:endonuclease/exonuclease/phosphatase family metal-dependent hydrolase